MNPSCFWLTEALIEGEVSSSPKSGGIAVIGSGLSGVSTAFWLQKHGFDQITLMDYEPEKSASFRNCGHILNGTVESMQALCELHGQESAKEIWEFSIGLCDLVGETVRELGIDAWYAQDGYLVIAIDDAENREVQSSTELLTSMGFHSEYVPQSKLEAMGFRNVFGGRFEKTSAQAHPTKFRNGILKRCLSQGLAYYSGVKVTEVTEHQGLAKVFTEQHGALEYDAVVIATNSYSPLLSSFFKEHRLVEPFRGQIITSSPLKSHFPVTYPHSFDHGYEYALRTKDNRLMIGGWRNNTPAGEIGTYDITPNPDVEEGLREFVKRHYSIDEDLEWPYSWSGIMATSKTGLPLIGPTNSQVIFTTAGYTGHGFSWAHGSAKLLADIMAGHSIPAVARHFNPKSI